MNVSGVSVDSAIGSTVATVQAIDPDTFTSVNVTYTLDGVTSHNSRRSEDTTQITTEAFDVDVSTGDVTTLSLMERFRDHYFRLTLNARDVEGLTTEGNMTVRWRGTVLIF